jgi:hypothetical protein
VTSPLHSARLRRVIAAYTVNSLGTWLGLVALLVAVYDHTHSALAVAATIFAGEALPAFLVPVVVARVEASRGGRELSALYVFEAVVTAGLAVLLWHFSLPVLLFLAALDGTAALAGSALLRAEIARCARDQVQSELGGSSPTTARPPDFEERAQEAERKANAARNVAFSLTFVLGPALGGALVAATDASTALFVDVGSFMICAALLLDLHPHVDEAGGDSVRTRLRAAWRHINEAPSLRGLLLAETVALIFFETGGPIEVAYAKTTLNAGDRGFGLILGSWGAGAVLGSLVFARLVRRPLPTMLCIGTVAIGLGYTGFALAPTLAVACVAALVGGIGNGMQWPSMISLVQKLTPQRLQGRLMGAVESLGALCRAIGLPLGGALVALSSPRLAFFVVGLGAVATTGVLFVVSRRSLKDAHPEAEAAAPASPASPQAGPGEPART